MSILPSHPPISEPPTGDVTFLFSDMEGSTRLWERFPAAMPAVLARHDALLQQALMEGGGHIFKRGGDSFCAAFHRADEALHSALTVQGSLHREVWMLPEGCAPRVRLALHTGPAEQRDADYFGVTLSRAARLLAAAHGGQTLASESAAALLRNSLPEQVRLLSQGRHRLKDLAQPLEIFQVVHPALPSEFPPLRSLESFAHNLPGQLTAFIGREAEMDTARRLLSETRLLTLTGTGGAGKSRLALQVAADTLDEYPDGVWLVELAPLTDPALLPQTLAAVLNAGEEPDRPLRETLIALLRPKTLLLILDNCEHLIDACARLAEELLRACPRLHLLATSREALEIGGETTLPVSSLPVPAPGLPLDSLARFESVRLFVDRATSVLPTFRLSAGNAPAVAQVCARLDGIPLALELAAARVKVLSPEQISARLDDRFQLLSGGSRTALPRQQTLRALIDWSYDLLLPAEQVLLRRLCIFSGGWPLEAAETVCAGAGVDERDILDLLSRLVAKSLVIVEPPEDGQVRYHLQENLRQYARQRLAQTDEEPALAARHRGFFLTLAEEAEQLLKGPHQVSWLNRLERDHDNFRAALTFSQAATELKETGLRLASALYRFWYVRGYLSEGLRWLETALARAGDVSGDLQARACTAAGVLTWALGDAAKARTYHENSLGLHRQRQDSVGIARSLANLGLVASQEENYALTRALFEESLTLYREFGTPSDVALMLNNLGNLLIEQKEFAAARSYCEESLHLSQISHNEKMINASLHNLGVAAEKMENHSGALKYYLESLTRQQEFGDSHGIALTMRGIARIAGSRGNYEVIALLMAAQEAHAAASGVLLSDEYQESDYAEHIRQAKEKLGSERFDALSSQGRAMSLETVMAFVLKQSKSLTE